MIVPYTHSRRKHGAREFGGIMLGFAETTHDFFLNLAKVLPPTDTISLNLLGAIRKTNNAFWACSRFSAWSKTTDCGPSMTSAVCSRPLAAGKQLMKIASFFACFMSSAFTSH